MSLLSVRHLTTAFPSGDRWLPAVQDVGFDIARGETLALVGESGSGKSLTAYSLLRLVPPPGRILSGEIRLDGRNLMDLPEREMERVRGAKISLIFQEPMSALNPVRTIGSQLMEAMTVHGQGGPDPRAAAIELLATVRMDDPARRFAEYPHQLSGGLRQRALIALALSCRPALIVADEPTTALDVTIQAQILHEVQKLCRVTRTAMVWITHDLAVVSGLADRIAVMYAGRIVESGAAAEVIGRPAHPYTQGLIDSIPSRRTHGSRLSQIPGMAPSLLHLPQGCAFRPRCPRAGDDCLQPPQVSQPIPGRTARCWYPLEAARG